MNRSVTNAIRYVLDEWVPPAIRDSAWFMFPFFWLAYNGQNIRQVMNFKRLVYAFSEDEYREFYAGLNTISRNRATDLNEPSIRAMLQSIPSDTRTLLDVGCGRGYFLERVKEARADLSVMGCDVVDKVEGKLPLTLGRIEALPFPDQSFDVVTCSHTLEHIIDPSDAIRELKRVARRLLFIVVPCQRYYFYTLDEHVNFYPQKEILEAQIGLPAATCEKLNGDWFLKGDVQALHQQQLLPP